MLKLNRAVAALCMCWLLAPLALADPQPMPDFIAGQSFTTVGIQTSGEHWLATVTIAPVIDPDQPSIMTLPDVGCTAEMRVVEATAERVIFKQTMIEGVEICASNGYLAIENSAIFMMPVFEYSPLSAMSPVESRGVLDSGPDPNYDILKRVGEQTVPRHPNSANITGSWETSGWLTRKCYQDLTDEPPEWFVGAEFKGALAIWTATSESGGHMFAAWTEDWESSEVQWTELKHHSGTMFEAPNGIFGRDDYHLVSARRENGKTELTLYDPDGLSYEKETVFSLCE